MLGSAVPRTGRNGCVNRTHDREAGRLGDARRCGPRDVTLPKQLIRASRESDEPCDGPSAVWLTLENVHALFLRRVLGAVHFRRQCPRQPYYRDIASHNYFVHVRIVIVELDVGPGQHLGEVCAQHPSRAMYDFWDRVYQIRRKEVANPCRVLCVERGRPALKAVHDSRLVRDWVSTR
jgi:hypothetical protein